MQLEFESDDVQKRIVGRFRMPREYQGGAGFVHGGIIALLLDEAMGKVNRFSEVRAVTAELTVEYRRPGPPEPGFLKLKVEAFEVVDDVRKNFQVRAREGWRIEKVKR